MNEIILKGLRHQAWCQVKANLETMFGYYHQEGQLELNHERAKEFYKIYDEFINKIEDEGYCD